MTCPEIRAELVDYHFGETSLETRPGVEQHLLSCPECLKDFIGLKREIETADLADRPSPEARARLRRAVAAEVARPATRGWSWWERPAAFLVAAALVLATLGVVRAVGTGPGAVPRSLEETPRTLPQTSP